MLYKIAVANSPPKPRSAHSFRLNSSGEFLSSARSHSNWSIKLLVIKRVTITTLQVRDCNATSLPDVSDVNVKFQNHPLVLLVLEEVVRLDREALDLLLDSCGDGRDEVERIEIQVVTNNLHHAVIL